MVLKILEFVARTFITFLAAGMIAATAGLIFMGAAPHLAARFPHWTLPALILALFAIYTAENVRVTFFDPTYRGPNGPSLASRIIFVLLFYLSLGLVAAGSLGWFGEEWR